MIDQDLDTQVRNLVADYGKSMDAQKTVVQEFFRMLADLRKKPALVGSVNSPTLKLVDDMLIKLSGVLIGYTNQTSRETIAGQNWKTDLPLILQKLDEIKTKKNDIAHQALFVEQADFASIALNDVQVDQLIKQVRYLLTGEA